MTSAGVANSGTVTTLKATHNIILMPGFKAANGSHVIAKIEDICMPPAPLIWEEEEEDLPADIFNSKEEDTALKTDHNFVLAPNPTADYFKIVSDGSIKGFGIYDLLGKEIFRGNGQEVDISNLMTGTYLVRIFFEDKVGLGLIVKQ